MVLALSSTFLGVERAWADSVIKTISGVGVYPFYIAFNPTNKDMYVTNYGSNTVSVVDSSTNTVIGTISVGIGNNPYGIAFNPTNNDMYVVSRNSNTVSVISTSTVVQPPTHTSITSVVDGNGNPVQNGGSTVSTSITFQVTATAGTNLIAGFQCSLDGSPFSTCVTTNPGRVSYNNLADGQHTFIVRAVDVQGNIDPNPATFSWTVLTPTQATHTTVTSAQLHLGTNTHQKQEYKTTGGTSPMSGSCTAASNDWISQSGGIHHSYSSPSLTSAPSTLSLF
jgi:YVTN family beta-propeller protein